MTGRLPDWERRLSEYLASAADWPHVYGSHDCFFHSWAAVKAVTGIDHAAPYLWSYISARGAAELLRSEGYGTLEAFVDARLTRKPVGMSGRGDLVMVGRSLGVCMGRDALFVGEEPGRAGLVTVPRAEWQKAWAVG